MPFIAGCGGPMQDRHRTRGVETAPVEGEKPMTPVQVRMARAALDLTSEDLSKKAGLSIADLEHLERGGQDGAASAKLKSTFEGAGIAFLEADGVRFDARQQARTIPLEAMNSANDE